MSKPVKPMLINFMNGGGLIWHRAQIFIANWFRIAMIFAFTLVASWFVLVQVFISDWGRDVFFKTQVARLLKTVFVPGYHLKLTTDTGETLRMSAGNIVRFVHENPALNEVIVRVYWLGSIALLIALAVAALAVYLNIVYGKKAQADEFLRGQKLVEPSILSSLIAKPSPIQIANIPLPEDLLPRNILCVGSSGTGKSQVIFPMFEDARRWGKKAIVYDKTGEYVQKFFRPGIDIILNPVDARCADWSIFSDLRKVTDPAMISRFFVPENKKSSDPVWDNAARMLLEDVIQIVARRRGTMEDVREIITQYPLDDLSVLLVKHGAASVGVINPKNERGSESVRLTLSAQPAIRFFTFFNTKATTFSIRDFVRREDDACLFLVSNSTQHESIKPFISAWVELALAEAMTMPPTDQIRMCFFLDELASLSKLNALEIALTEARKYGIVSIVGIQNLSQMDEIYGQDLTRVMVANLQNKFILRTEEESSAKRLSDTLGKEEVEEVNESKSFGVESSRDGVNLGTKRTERHLVTPTEIMTLPDLTGYLKIAGAYPISKLTFDYKPRKNENEGYIERAGLNLVLDEPHQSNVPEQDEDEGLAEHEASMQEPMHEEHEQQQSGSTSKPLGTPDPW